MNGAERELGPNRESDANDRIKRLKRECALSIFPELVERLVAAGQIVQAGEGQVLQAERRQFQNVIVPLRGSIGVSAYTGLPSEELVDHNVAEFTFIGLIEVLEKGRSPMTVKAVEDSWILSIPAAAVTEIVGGSVTLMRAIRLLASSPALEHFCQILRQRRVPSRTIAKALLAVDSAAMRYTREMPLDPDDSVLFVQSGRIYFHSEEQSFSLENGDFFGASWRTSRKKYQVSVLESCYLHTLKLGKLDEETRNAVQPILITEPCFPRHGAGDKVAKSSVQLNGISYKQHAVSEIEMFGSKCEPSRMTFSEDTDTWGTGSLSNWFAIMGLKIGARDLRTFVQLNPVLSPLRIAKFVERYGYVARSQRTGLSIGDLEFPSFIFFVGRPVILVGALGNRIYWMDPALGLVSAPWSQFLANWDGQSLMLDVTESHDATLLAGVTAGNREAVARKYIKSNMRKVSALVRNVAFLEFFQILTSLIFPPLLSIVLTDSLKSKDITHLPLYMLGLGIVVTFQMVSGFLTAVYQQSVGNEQSFQINSQFFRQYLHLTMSGSQLRGAQFLAKPFQFDFYQQSQSQFAARMPSQLIFITLLTCVFGFYSWQIAMFALLMVGLTIAISYFLARTRINTFSGLSSANVNLYERLTEFATAFSSIKSYSIEGKIRKRVEKSCIELFELDHAIAQADALRGFAIRLITIVMVFGALYLCVRDFETSRLTFGAFIAISVYLGFFQAPLRQISNLVTRYVLAAKGSESFLPPAPPSRTMNNANEVSVEFRGEVTFEKVSFRYNEKSRNAVNDLSFTVKAGQVIAIVGRSGSGKTTLAKLIAAQMLPTAGKIKYDGFETREVASGSLREQMGFVSQDLQLFSGSILTNIAYDEDAPDLERVKAVAKASHAHQFIRHLPNHYFYNLAENGTGLSAGQRHQIALARALYRRPRLLVIDEATAYLDPESEKAVSESLSRLMVNNTIFLVIHRLFVARRANLILVMKNGHLVEVGTHEDLIRRNGEYTELYRHQIGLEDS